jgi:hypothetical protein
MNPLLKVGFVILNPSKSSGQTWQHETRDSSHFCGIKMAGLIF